MANNPQIDVLIPHMLTDLQVQALHVWLATISAKLERRRPFARRNQQQHDQEREQRELLLLRLQLWQEAAPQHQQFVNELATLQHLIQTNLHHYWHIGVTDGTQLETRYPITNAVRPFSVDLRPFYPSHWDNDYSSEDELCQLLMKLGTIPKYRVQFTGFLESPDDTLLCGYMAAELAQQYDAYAKVILRPHFYTDKARAQWQHTDSQALARTLAGETHDIAYTHGQEGTVAHYHLLNGAAMRAWVQHERFHLHV